MHHWSYTIAAVLALATAVVAQPTPLDAANSALTGRYAGAGSPAVRAAADEPIPASIQIQDIARLHGQGRFTLRGLGIVVGLNGTGDSGSELVLARPLAEVYRNNGNPIGDLKDLGKSKSAAMVWVDCDIPESGGRIDDQFDVHVSAIHSASSLAGGRLIVCPLSGPLPSTADNPRPPYAMAWGPISLEGAESSRVGRIRQGAQMIQNTMANPINGVITLVVKPEARGWTTTGTIANQINGSAGRLDDEAGSPAIARALDETMVEIFIPEQERADPANFISRILTMRLSPTLLSLPAEVIVNERLGIITVTGEVEISPIAVAHKDLVVTTTIPSPQPTAKDPMIQRDKWVPIATSGRTSERARLDDLLRVFRQLDVPVKDQIQIITQIHDSKRLHAHLRIE